MPYVWPHAFGDASADAARSSELWPSTGFEASWLAVYVPLAPANPPVVPSERLDDGSTTGGGGVVPELAPLEPLLPELPLEPLLPELPLVPLVPLLPELPPLVPLDPLDPCPPLAPDDPCPDPPEPLAPEPEPPELPSSFGTEATPPPHARRRRGTPMTVESEIGRAKFMMHRVSNPHAARFAAENVRAVAFAHGAPSARYHARNGDYGSMMRPGADFAPLSVWQELQSPSVCGVNITRSLPP
jgi:hypothetical protein